jgi:geranylgeranyl reductase
MLDSYDVVIVGAGPGGLNCAHKLNGKKVLLLEQNPEIGPKVCAGGISGEDLDYLKIPDKLLDCKLEEILVHTSDGKVARLNNSFDPFTIERKNLGQWQLKQLGKNVTVRTGCKVTKIGKDYVIVNGSEKAAFKYLVGADGSSSLVRRHLGLESRDVGITMQYIIPGQHKDMEIFLDAKLFGVWYAWIFPHKGYISVGCGCDPKVISPGKLRKNFHKWMQERGIDFSNGQYESCPINVDFRGYRFGNIFLVGDAAGLASCLTGEGIYQALISGEEIARLILNPKHSPTKLEKLITEKKEETLIVKRLNSALKKRGPVPEIEQELLRLFEQED